MPTESAAVDQQPAPLDLTEQITTRTRDGRSDREVPALTVAPGLAIVQARDYNDVPMARRYRLTHVPSGLAFPHTCCATHIREVAEAAVRGGDIDWTKDVSRFRDEPRFKELVRDLAAYKRCCRRRTGCPGDPVEPPPWEIRCATCDWEHEYDEEHDDPIDAKVAKELADDHQCVPEVQISPPTGTAWYPTFLVGDDGTIRGVAVSHG